jgi:molybdate transport system substrate-binding protein
MRLHLATLTVVLCVLSACTSDGATPPSTTGAAVELTVYGAASLNSALAQVKVAYEAAVPGTTLTIANDSSAALATQIELGAPADVFLSADATNPQKLVDAGYADGEAIEFAGNALTIITPTDNPGGLTTAFDLGKAGIRVIAAGDEVPITRYAAQLVDNLANLPGAPADFATIYAANIASREDNVAAVRTKIELGEGDAAIVYVTDAVAFGRGTSIEVPDGANVRATYAGVVVKASTQPEAARAFLAWIAGPAGQEILGGLGFLPPA